MSAPFCPAPPDDFPALSDAVLLSSLQEDDGDLDERRVWLDGEESARARPRPRASRPASCHRPCGEDGDDGAPMICYFRWRLEAYVTMGRYGRGSALGAHHRVGVDPSQQGVSLTRPASLPAERVAAARATSRTAPCRSA